MLCSVFAMECPKNVVGCRLFQFFSKWKLFNLSVYISKSECNVRKIKKIIIILIMFIILIYYNIINALKFTKMICIIKWNKNIIFILIVK